MNNFGLAVKSINKLVDDFNIITAGSKPRPIFKLLKTQYLVRYCARVTRDVCSLWA